MRADRQIDDNRAQRVQGPFRLPEAGFQRLGAGKIDIRTPLSVYPIAKEEMRRHYFILSDFISSHFKSCHVMSCHVMEEAASRASAAQERMKERKNAANGAPHSGPQRCPLWTADAYIESGL